VATITSGTGLISGINYSSLVDQLIAIDARPRDQIVRRISSLDAQRAAFMDISARITAMLTQVNLLANASFFHANQASSSNASIVSASAGETANPGAYSFIVRALATTHQMVSNGFTASDAATPPGTLTLESAAARVNRSTALEELNGYSGVQRGAFKITDGSGKAAVIDIREAQTLSDVIDRINSAGIGVTADLRGESMLLTDTSGGTQGILVSEMDDGRTAASLGFGVGHRSSTSGELVGSDLTYLTGATPLSGLNDGLGVRRTRAGGDFTIQSTDPAVTVKVDLSGIVTDTTRLERLNHGNGVDLGTIRVTTRNGKKTEVDLSDAKTIGDVKQTIESAVSGVSVIMADGRLIFTDTTNATDSNLIVEDKDGHAARDLGILGNTEKTKIDGRTILKADSLADVIAAIRYGDGNREANGTPVIDASIASDGRSLTITDHGQPASGGPTTLAVVGNSNALLDLGFKPGTYDSAAGSITGDRVLAGMNTVLLKTLNGGAGLQGGTINIAANGQSAAIDLQSAKTLRDVVEQINAAAKSANLGVEAGYDSTGTRLVLTNRMNDAADITVSDVTGRFAQSAGIAGTSSRVQGDNLQHQYISELTQLKDLNGDHGVAAGKFTITNSAGLRGTVDVNNSTVKSLQDVIDTVNSLKIGVEARINDTGDGLLLVDTAGGTGKLTVAEQDGTTAHDLNLLGTATDGKIDGSYEYKIDLNAGGTLEDLVNQINDTTLASATIINDGSPTAPYRVSVASRTAGRAGELIIDDGGALGFATLTPAQNARGLLGGPAGTGLLISSSSNTLTEVVKGVTLNLTGVSDDPVTVNVSRNVDGMVTSLKGLVDSYNSLASRIDELSGYNADTQTAGILQCDSTLQIIDSRLFRAFTASMPDASGSLKRLSQLGLKIEQTGLTFDESQFREAYANDPEQVSKFFTTAQTGVAVQLQDALKRISDSDGMIKRQDTSLQSQRDMLSARVDQLNTLLEAKRQRMLKQFQTMEQTLAQLQSQQSALSSFTSLFSTTSSSSSST
jgi:flagellar hook-associated protein 2